MNFSAKKLLFVAVFTVFSSGLANADMVIIVNKNNAISSISKEELARIFLGKSSAFSDGSKAIAVNQTMSNGIRSEFDQSMLNRSQSQIKAYWSKMLFSGDGTPPEELDGDIGVLQKVMKESAAIGYIDSSAVNDAVKVVSIN